MTPKTPPRRGRPPTGGREQILDAAFELLDENGVAKMTTRAIAQRAGVSEGSIFYHFKDRAGLLRAVFEASMQPLEVFGATAPLETDLRETLGVLALAVEGFLGKGLVVMFAAQSDDELRTGMHEYMDVNNLGPQHGIRFIAAYLDTLQRHGVVRDDIDTTAAASFVISSCLLRVSNRRLIGNMRGIPTRDDMLDTLVTMLAPPRR